MAIKDPKRTVICADCGREIVIPYTTYTYNRRNNKPFRCKECSRLFKSKQTTERWNAMSDEEKQKWSEQSKQNQANLSDETKEKLSKLRSETRKKFWANASEETKERIASKRDEGFKKWYEENPSEASEILANNARMLWDNMNEEEREEKVKSLHAGHKAWFDSLTDQEREEFGIKHGNISRNYWNNVSEETRGDIYRKLFLRTCGRNGLHKLFESRFNKKFGRIYSTKREVYESNNSYRHHWDYGIYKDDKLICLVDLDGAYFHGDNTDYDGVHSRLEYDSIRLYGLNDKVPYVIIRELEFDVDFNEMIKVMNMKYDDFIEYKYNHIRVMPFPFISNNSIFIMRRYHDLDRLNYNNYRNPEIINNRMGDMIVYNFHHSIWNDLQIKWKDDKQLREWIENGTVYHSHLNKNKLLIGLWPNTISAGQYKLILSKYLENDQFVYDPKMDPSLILALIVTQRPIHRPERNETITMIDFLVKYGVKVECTDTIGTMLTTVENDEEINEIMTKYNASKYAFLVKETSMGAVTDIGIYGHKLVIIKK